jgi:hypothetical protein
MMPFPTARMIACAALMAGAACPRAAADDAVVNTPTVIAALAGEWELQPRIRGEFRQRLSFDGSRCGEWQQSAGALPVSITFYVEGRELLVQHYHEPRTPFDYRLKQQRFGYRLDADTLTLTAGGASETWKRLPKDGR